MNNYADWLQGLSALQRITHKNVPNEHSALPDPGVMASFANWVNNAQRPEREFMLGGAANYADQTARGDKSSYLDLAMASLDMLPGMDDLAVKGTLAALGKTSLMAGLPLSLGTISGRYADDVPELMRETNLTYHSGTADQYKDIEYGIEPGHGEWIREVASGAGENPDELLEQSVPALWAADKPEWIAAKVAKKLDKPVGEVTQKDIEKHGHLAIIHPEDAEGSLFRVGPEGLDQGEYSTVTSVGGEKLKLYDTPLYEYNDMGGPNKTPFGVERDEWISADPIEPVLNLTGQDLIDYLIKYHPEQAKKYGISPPIKKGSTKGLLDK